MEKKLKILALLLMALLLFIPLIQLKFHFLEPSKKLSGSYQKTEKPVFSSELWFNNTFQQDFEKYFNQNFGFRNTLVRLHNQINYSLFKKAEAKGVIVGKNNYLYETNYINSYNGTNYIGKTEIVKRVEELQIIYDHLKQHNTELLVIIAPGKAYFYPEHIPNYLSMKPSDSNNYKIYLSALSQTNIPIIDFNTLFVSMKDTSSIVLYPKTGIHWSQASIPFVIDSILKKTEILLHKNLNHVITYRGPDADTVDRQDSDIERGMNLIYPIDKLKMNYPKWHFENNATKDKPKMVAIGDSFWWQLYSSGISKHAFNNAQFWYYYKEIYPQSNKKDLFVKDIYALQKLEQSDIVILMTTEANLTKFPFGFEDVMSSKPYYDSIFNRKVENLKNYIKTNESWFNKVKAKAQENMISIDSMLQVDAEYTIRKEEIKNNK